MWHSLIASFAVVGLFVFGWMQSQEFLGRMRRPYRRAIFGLVMGTGSIVSMLLSAELQPGVFFDLRSSFVALAGLLGGPIAVTVTAAMTAAYRLAMGGIGSGGAMLGIAIAAAMGIAAHAWLGRRTPNPLEIVLFSLAAAMVPLLAVTVLPEPARSSALGAALPMVLLGFAATAAAAFSISQGRGKLEERKLLLAAIAQSPDYLFVKDRNSRFIAVNNMVATENGFGSPAELLGKTDFDIAPFEHAKALFDAEQEIIKTGGALLNYEEFIASGTSPPRWFLTSKIAVRNIDGEVLGLAGVTRDITERKALERALLDGRKHLDLVLTEMSDGLAQFDARGYLQFSNERYRALFPLTGRLRVPGAYLPDILRTAAEGGEQFHGAFEQREAWIASVMATLAAGGEEEVSLLDGRWLHIRTRPMSDGGATVVVSDITNLKRAEAGLMALTEQLRLMATTDALTGLVNRRGFDERLAEEVSRAQRNRLPLSLIMVDIDRFKSYNDHYGHQAGDECLKRVAAALRAGCAGRRTLPPAMAARKCASSCPRPTTRAPTNSPNSYGCWCDRSKSGTRAARRAW